jgi:hypothetical protein
MCRTTSTGREEPLISRVVRSKSVTVSRSMANVPLSRGPERVVGDAPTDPGPFLDRRLRTVDDRFEQDRPELLYLVVAGLDGSDEAFAVALERDGHRRIEEIAQIRRYLPDCDVEDGIQRDRQLVVLTGRQHESLLREDDAPPNRLVPAGDFGVEFGDEVRDNGFRHISRYT